MEQKQQEENLPREPKAENAKTFFFDFIKIFVIAVAIIIPVRFFLFQPFVVTGDSMIPNFEDGDYLIIDELSYNFRKPERGEVIVLRFPNDPSQFFIKRIIGLPGERLKTEEGMVVVFNDEHPQGFVLTEPYLTDNKITFGDSDITLADDEFFVLGDNRLSSSDSRIWGPLKEDLIVGRAYIRAFPVMKFDVFTSPEY